MSEWLNKYPPSEQVKQGVTELGKSFIGCQLNKVDSSVSGGRAVPGEIRFSLYYGIETPTDQQGELIFGIREEDLIGLEFEPKKGEGFIIPFLEEGERIRRYDNEIGGPFNGVIRDQKIETINFRHLDEERSRFSLWLSDGSRIHMNTLREPKGRVMVKEIRKDIKTGQKRQRWEEFLLPGTTERYLRPNEGPTEG